MLGRPNTQPSTDRSAGTSPNLRDVARRYGFRRVDRVHLIVGNGATAAKVTGVTHRYPHSLPAPLSVAARLIAAGAPLSIEQVDAAPRGTERP